MVVPEQFTADCSKHATAAGKARSLMVGCTYVCFEIYSRD